jgi:hypothetical protein
VVQLELQEPHQPGAALGLGDQRAELLVGGGHGQLAEQPLDVGPADPGVDGGHDVRERPVADDDVAAYFDGEHLFRGHEASQPPDEGGSNHLNG